MSGEIRKIDRNVLTVLVIIFVIGALTGSNLVMAAMPIAAILYLVIRFRFDFVISHDVDEVLEPKKTLSDRTITVARYHEDYEEKRKRK